VEASEKSGDEMEEEVVSKDVQEEDESQEV
jgi:hypothetical protein